MPKTLYDLSTYDYIKYGIDKLRLTGSDSYKVCVLLKYNITSYGMLAALIDEGVSELREPVLLMQLSHAIKCLEKINARGNFAKTYEFKAYEDYSFPTILYKNDMQVNASLLPVKAITNASYSLEYRISKVSVYDARILLEHLSLNGKNALINTISDVGPKKAEVIAKAIEFYESQILRIAASTPDIFDYDGILFFKDREAKRKLITSRLPEIIEFFKNSGPLFIWDGLQNDTSNNKLQSILSNDTSYAKRVVANLIDILVYYTTLEELEKNNLEPTLARFKKS